MGNRASPSVRCYYLSCTSVDYDHPPTYTVRSITQYSLSSILQFFLHTRCFHTATKSFLVVALNSDYVSVVHTLDPADQGHKPEGED
jgi:hypothetical protein